MNNGNLALLIPIILSVGLFALIFGIYYLRNRERMAMIERGMEPHSGLPKQRQSNPAFTLTFGLLLIGSGLGLFIAWLIATFIVIYNSALYISLIAIFGGLGLFTAYLIESKSNRKKEL